MCYSTCLVIVQNWISFVLQTNCTKSYRRTRKFFARKFYCTYDRYFYFYFIPTWRINLTTISVFLSYLQDNSGIMLYSTLHHTQCVPNYLHFPHIAMVIAWLWARLMVCVLLKAPDLFLPKRIIGIITPAILRACQPITVPPFLHGQHFVGLCCMFYGSTNYAHASRRKRFKRG